MKYMRDTGITFNVMRKFTVNIQDIFLIIVSCASYLVETHD